MKLLDKIGAKAMEDRFTLRDTTIICVLGLVVLNWFRGNYFITNPGNPFAVNPSEGFFSTLYVWKDSFSLGSALANIQILPFHALWAFVGIFFSISTAQKIVFYLLFVGSGLSMYYLVSMIGLKKEGRVFAALFYMMNPYSMSVIWWNQLFWIFTYILVPTLLGLFVKVLEGRGLFRQTLLICIVLIMLSPGLIAAYIPMLIISFGTYLLLHILLNRRDIWGIKNSIKISGFVVFFGVLVSAWWLFPWAKSIPEFYSMADPSNAGKALSYASRYSTITNTVRMLGYSPIHARFRSDFYYDWISIYSSTPFLLMSFLFPIVGLSSFLSHNEKTDKEFLLYFAILSLIGIFLMKGAAPPFGQINMALLDLPFGGVFRHPYDKFGNMLAMSYAVLLGFMVSRVLKAIKQRKKYIFFSIVLPLLIAVFVTLNYPFFNGDVISSAGHYKPSYRVKIPGYYFDAKLWLQSQGDHFNIISLPELTSSGGVAYKWKDGIQVNRIPFQRQFFERPILDFSNGNPYSDMYIEQLSNLFLEKKIRTLQKTLGLANTKYVLLHEDWNSVYPSPSAIGPDYYRKILHRLGNIKLAGRFENLSFYEISDYTALIYGTSAPIYIKGDANLDNIALAMRVLNIRLNQKTLFLFNEVDAQIENLKARIPVVMPLKYGDGKTGYIIDIPRGGNYKIKITGSRTYPLDVVYELDHTGFKMISLRNAEDQIELGKLEKGRHTISIDVMGHSYNRTLKAEDERLFSGEKWERNIGNTVFDSDESEILVPNNSLGNYTLKSKINLERDGNPWGEFSNISLSKTNLIDRYVVYSTDGLDRGNPTINFEKVSPVKYRVNVSEATSPFFLVLGQSYDKDWDVQLKGGSVITHMPANVFANSWYIVPEEDNVKIEIHFSRQQDYIIWTIISLLALATLVYLTLRKGKSR